MFGKKAKNDISHELFEAREEKRALGKLQGFATYTMQGVLIEANDAFLKIFGYKFDEIKGKKHSVFVSPEYFNTEKYREFYNTLALGKEVIDDFPRVNKAGESIWVNSSYSTVRDESGNPVKVIECSVDVTEQKLKNIDYRNQINAIHRSQAVVEFQVGGAIQKANKHFLDIFGYTMEEIKGKNHSIFLTPEYVKSEEYKQFFQDVGSGKDRSGVFRMLSKTGREIWVSASYCPLKDEDGVTYRVIEYANDVTEQKMKDAEAAAQMASINRSQAVITFGMDGTVLDANDNFLNVVGYDLSEIKGKHHSMFVASNAAASPRYKKFWEDLNKGIPQVAEFKRIGKGGKEIFIQASYNPILDLNGKPNKVVKYAIDLTVEKNEHRKMMTTLADNFQSRVSSIVSSVASASTELSHTAELMSKSISESNGNAQEAVQSSQETYQNVQSVAAASEQMSSTIKEISSQTQNSNLLISDSVEKVKGAGVYAGDLQKASQQVRNVIQLISNISSQINLLALNATIESARAGEAGKGFAVVANEVRNLAGQTNKSIQDIEKVITEMSHASDGVISALGGIKESVDKIYASSAGVASAVEEQSAVVNDIAQNMNVATHKTQAVKENITMVSQLSSEAEHSSHQVLLASQDLSQQAEQLQQEIDTFLVEIRAG